MQHVKFIHSLACRFQFSVNIRNFFTYCNSALVAPAFKLLFYSMSILSVQHFIKAISVRNYDYLAIKCDTNNGEYA